MCVKFTLFTNTVSRHAAEIACASACMCVAHRSIELVIN